MIFLVFKIPDLYVKRLKKIVFDFRNNHIFFNFLVLKMLRTKKLSKFRNYVSI